LKPSADSLVKNNVIEAVIINLRDITDRKKAEQNLFLIKKAVESSGDAIGLSDPEGHYFYHNKAFTDLFGYTVEELQTVGGGPSIYVDKDVGKTVFDTIKDGGSWSGETELISKSGNKFTVLLRADAIKDDSGKIIGLIGLHTDMTEIKKAERLSGRAKKIPSSGRSYERPDMAHGSGFKMEIYQSLGGEVAGIQY